MGAHSVTYPLELSQEQLKAFLEFRRLGDKLSSFLFHCNSYTYSIADVMRWDQACMAVFYIHAAGSLFGYLPKYSLQLSLEHVAGLRDLLAVANKFQTAFLQLPLKKRIAENEELYLCFTAAQGMFYDQVRSVIAKAHL